MTRKERYQSVLNYFRKQLPSVTTELQFGSCFQLLCATILSAQCTDKRVNEVTPELFRHFPDAKTMSKAVPEDVLAFINSVSYPNSKARHLVEMAQMLVSEFGGEVPSDAQSLMKLPGVGRKTANVVQAVWFGKPTMAVDTHVYRVSHRLGLVPSSANTPRKVEEVLMHNIPIEDISNAHHWLLLHGRYVCQSAKPKCSQCPFDSFCPHLMNNSKL